MGRIKTKRIKRYTRQVMKEGEFSTDYSANKTKFDEVAKAQSKKIRNIIAGYITRLTKKQQQE